MAVSSKPIPEGYHTLTPHLVIRGAAEAIEFYKKALGAEEIMRMASPDGKIAHAELKIGDSVIFVADEFPNQGVAKSPQTVGGTTASLFLYVPDVDKAFQRAVSAGAKTTMPLADMFWGDRYGTFTDPFGHAWGMATHKEDVSPKDMEERARDFYAQMAQQAQKKTA